MKKRIFLLLTLFIIILGSCRAPGPPRPHHVFVIPEYKTRHHWGAPRHNSVKSRYWGRHRWGPRPHPNRGRYHD